MNADDLFTEVIAASAQSFDPTIEIEHKPFDPSSIEEINMATLVVEFGDSMGWTFKELPHKGVLNTKVTDGMWIYEPYTNQPLIKEAEKRLFAVGTRFPLAGIVWGDEIEDPLPKIEWEQIRKVTTTVLGALVVATGTAVTIGVAALTHVDPCLIVILDDEHQTWIQICSWLKR